MRKLLWLLLLGALCNPALAQQGSPTGPAYNFFCNNSVPMSWSVAATTSTLVVGSGIKGIYICGWHATTANTSSQSTFQLGYGATATTSTLLTPPLGISSTAPSVDHIDFGALSVPSVSATTSPNNLFINVGGAGNSVQFLLYYGQY